MKYCVPRTPFSTPLSGSAKEVELRLKNIISGPKKRPPLPFLALMFAVCILCGNLVSCHTQGSPGLSGYSQAVLQPGAVQLLDHIQGHLFRTQTVSLGEFQGKPLSLELEEHRTDHLNGFQVDRIRVLLDGQTVQTILPPEAMSGTMDDEWTDWLYEGLFDFSPAYTEGSPMIMDLNFDGHMDFGLMSTSSFSRNVPYVFYLWDPEREQFNCFVSFNLDLKPHADTQTLQETIYDTMGDTINWYAWEDGKLVLIRREVEDVETYYYAESVLRDGHWYNRLNVHIFERENGQLIQKEDETRYFPAG